MNRLVIKKGMVIDTLAGYMEITDVYSNTVYADVYEYNEDGDEVKIFSSLLTATDINSYLEKKVKIVFPLEDL